MLTIEEWIGRRTANHTFGRSGSYSANNGNVTGRFVADTEIQAQGSILRFTADTEFCIFRPLKQAGYRIAVTVFDGDTIINIREDGRVVRRIRNQVYT